MPQVGKPQVTSGTDAIAGISVSLRNKPFRIVRAANDNHSVHAPWRRVVAASMAVLFAASLILVGLVCIANANSIIVIGS